MKYKVTWVEAGTRNAACIGRDEVVESTATIDEVRQDALYHADCAGVNLDRYEPVVEIDLQPLCERLDLIGANMEVEPVAGSPGYLHCTRGGWEFYCLGHDLNDWAFFTTSGDLPEALERIRSFHSVAAAQEWHEPV